MRLVARIQKIMYCNSRILKYFSLCVILLIAACASQPEIRVEALPSYDALFERSQGWTGADGAYSVPLTENVVVWLFGDTWVGAVREGKHVDAGIVNNSVAIQTGLHPPAVSLDFFLNQAPDGRPEAFILPADGRGWFWIYHGMRVEKGLYLFLIQLERTEDSESFGFKLIESWLGHVVNPDEPPSSWQVSQQRIPWDRFAPAGDTVFGSALLRENGFVYIYGTTETVIEKIRRKSMILARVPETDLAEFDRWRFFAGGRWVNDFTRAEPLCGEIANEYSVSFVPALGEFAVVYSENGFSKNIVARFAPNPWGPWSHPQNLYECPEMTWGNNVFCYAAKGHPELSGGPQELIVTYVANSMDFEEMDADARLYRPRFIRVRFKRSR